jgi:hypothetical protein
LNRYSWSLTIALRISITQISRSGAKIIKLLYERDELEGYVARDLCILMKEVSWNPDRTVMNEIVHMYYLGVQKVQQSHLQKSKIILSEIIPEEILT